MATAEFNKMPTSSQNIDWLLVPVICFGYLGPLKTSIVSLNGIITSMKIFYGFDFTHSFIFDFLFHPYCFIFSFLSHHHHHHHRWKSPNINKHQKSNQNVKITELKMKKQKQQKQDWYRLNVEPRKSNQNQISKMNPLNPISGGYQNDK